MEAVNGGLIKLGDDRAKLETLNSILWHGRSREHVPLLKLFPSPDFPYPLYAEEIFRFIPNLLEKEFSIYFFEDEHRLKIFFINLTVTRIQSHSIFQLEFFDLHLKTLEIFNNFYQFY